jgi:Ca-activated chloride channel family protein
VSLFHPWFAHPLLLTLLAALPALGLLALGARRQRRRRLQQLASQPALRALAQVRAGRRILRDTCLALGLACLAVGVAGPQWGREPGQSIVVGRDLVVLLDMSWSMHADDVLPHRLGRCCEALRDLADAVQKGGGHRLALVAFAGRPHVLCPLTPDLDHFRAVVRALESDAPPPELWPTTEADAVSGTRIGAGLVAALEAHDPRFQGRQAILLLSDGDDPARDGEWRRGALAAREAVVPVFTVGVGSPDTPRRIPLPQRQGFLQHNGEDVWTRLEEAPLEEIARLTGGAYVPARTSALPLGELFRERIEPGAVREADADALPVYRPRYAWLFVPALLLLTAATLISDARKPRPEPAPGATAEALP